MPEVTPWNRPFWTGGADGELRLPTCSVCGQIEHPSQTVCRACLADLDEWTTLSGKATVLGVTVNHQMFMPGFAPPYAVALVALDGAPGVNLTTNLVDVDLDHVRVGMRVSVRFDEQRGVWYPVFAPTGEPDEPVDHLVQPPAVQTRAPSSSDKPEDKAYIRGIGMSAIGRRLGRSPLSLTKEAVQAALDDAGLAAADIDGLSTYPGMLGQGMSEGGISAVEEMLQIRPVWFNGSMETPGQAGAVTNAMLAVASGLCKHVLVFRTVWESSHADYLRTGQLPLPGGGAVPGFLGWRMPYGASSAANWIGMIASQYFHRYGGDRETSLAPLALNARANAGLNPNAVYRDPLTMEDYLSARVISTPFGLFDCDVPVDAGVAFVVSAIDTASDAPKPPVRFEAVGTQITERPSWDLGTVTHLPMVAGPAAHLWTRTTLRPDDVDVAEIYDGFTFNAVSWIESLGFCGLGEGADFLNGGRTIALDGPLPMNTHGGQLSAGRTHGFGFIHEAVTQLRGEAGDRQVAGAQVALAAVGGGTPAGCFLFRRD